MSRVYLDNAATTKIRPEALAAMTAAYSEYGNPSSVHHEGQSALKALECARETIAAHFNCDPAEVYFTSGGTESDNWAVSFAGNKDSNRRNIITSSIEHPAVLQACKRKEEEGFHVTYLPVDQYGSVSPDDLEKVISDDTALVSVMMVNNEIGTIEPIIKLSEIAHA
ncbi:MAG: aminotransferase class V-fold PLP-dependent enzyme, partial [Saccharofermentanaceae bacterium]|nr:aminotransferase class V-fold PLP-dependent enzyme [Saccharofermentanaceae bacterium]